MKVKDVMTRHVVAVAPTATAAQAAVLMAQNRVSCVAVIRGHRLVGLITDRDLVTHVLARGRDPAIPVIDLLHELRPGPDPWPFVRPDTDTRDAARLMGEHHARRLPVLDGDGVVGIVSLADLARAQDESLLSVLQQLS